MSHPIRFDDIREALATLREQAPGTDPPWARDVPMPAPPWGLTRAELARSRGPVSDRAWAEYLRSDPLRARELRRFERRAGLGLAVARVRAPWWRRIALWLRGRRAPLALPGFVRRPYVAPAVASFDAIADGYVDSDGPVDYDLGDGVIYRRPPRPTSMPSGGVPMLG